MKKIIYFSFLMVLMACESDLDQVPLSYGTTESFYANQNDFEQARNATYSSGLYSYPTRLMNLSETRSDNIYTVPDVNYAWSEIHNFYTSITANGFIEEAYATNYNTIYKVNQLLEKLDENGQVIIDTDIRLNIRAEAHFMRAFCYFDLIRWFGPVPLLDRTVSPQEAAKIPRSSVENIYQLVIEDLKFAVENLPESYDDENYGRVSKYAAKGILALVYMTRSSETYGIDGPGLNSGEWNLAYQQLNDIRNSGQFQLEEEYSRIFRTEGTQNTENVFVIPFLESTGNSVGTNFMSEHIGADSYFASLGLSAQGASEGRFVSPDLRSSFAEGDLRAEFGIVDSYVVDEGRWEGSYDRPVYSKYADVTRYGDSRTDWGVDFMVLRYTDILMLMAECTLQGGGGAQADVDFIINKVRERAGLPADAVNVTLEELFQERQKEFFAEGNRWFDLYRTGNAINILNNWKTEVDDENALRGIDPNSLIYPIPLQEILSNPGLYEQNPGYN
ncbi:RagB/SusD family nutrient uptake outer membrane protein [Mesonia aestuariivivens]|uniref:RagB/SusD family nutrient uptake outer membrane protein n=1 Tax=Mesonia aestuariivivens TaxID=2796128 RepID=A0ABS6W526_9FLAO|nr:RagB/SusD family nutrient uptake outer membrane protein [Mesonia aestuariivivens]MBW2962627.1 RagB/SusD family nutrient uptake outer membrane protein [Mesonia aestuariivivens]